MVIGLISNTYPPDLNGVSITTGQLAKSLRAKEVQVFVAVPKVRGVSYPDYVIPLKSLPVPKSFRSDIRVPYFYTKQVVEFFTKNKVELIHSHDTFFGGMEAAQVAQELDVPSVHTYHTFIEAYRSLNVIGYKTFVREYSKLVCNKYDHVIALSHKMFKYLKELEIQTDISKFLNVTDTSNLVQKPFDETVASDYDINSGDFVILTFGRISKEKGLINALKVVEPILKTHKNAKYLIAGHGSFVKNLKKYAIKLGIESQVIFSGKYSPSDLSNLCSFAKIFLFTSESDNLPTTILEAMACGLPVLSINDSSVDYVLKHGYNGYKADLPELSQLCGRLYSEPELQSKLANQARESAVEMQNRDTIQEYIDLYFRLISNHKPESLFRQIIDHSKLSEA
jgi:1,2-diacylglycerol 3-alpha-glucosyltransferase